MKTMAAEAFNCSWMTVPVQVEAWTRCCCHGSSTMATTWMLCQHCTRMTVPGKPVKMPVLLLLLQPCRLTPGWALLRTTTVTFDSGNTYDGEWTNVCSTVRAQGGTTTLDSTACSFLFSTSGAHAWPGAVHMGHWSCGECHAPRVGCRCTCISAHPFVTPRVDHHHHQYEGTFREGVMSGLGTKTWPDGKRYVGVGHVARGATHALLCVTFF